MGVIQPITRRIGLVAERRLNLAQPLKAGITAHHPQFIVALATVETFSRR